jgi:type IV pilus assembly protein PilE
MDVANREKQYLLDARSYASTLTALTMTAPVDVSRNYTVTISAPGGTPPTFVITAAPKAGSKQAGDGNLTLDDTGAKTHGAATTW